MQARSAPLTLMVREIVAAVITLTHNASARSRAWAEHASRTRTSAATARMILTAIRLVQFTRRALIMVTTQAHATIAMGTADIAADTDPATFLR